MSLLPYIRNHKALKHDDLQVNTMLAITQWNINYIYSCSRTRFCWL